MPQIVNSQIEGINAQRKANDKDKMRWDPNQFLQSAIQKKQITMGQQKYADQTEALIQAGLVAEGSNNEYGNMHRVYTDWAKPEQIEKIKEIEKQQEQKKDEVIQPGPSGKGNIGASTKYPLGNTGIGTNTHIANTIFGNPYQMSESDNLKLDNIIPAMTPEYFANGGKLNVFAGHDATKFAPEHLQALRDKLGKPDLTDAEAQYILSTSRATDMSRGIHNSLMSKGIALPLNGIQINPYKGNTVKNEAQRFSGFGLSGEYSDAGKKFESKPPVLPKGSTAYDPNTMTATMQEWKKNMDNMSAFLKVQNPAYVSKRMESLKKNKESKGAK